VIGTNREWHREPRRAAYCRRGTIKPQGEVWGNALLIDGLLQKNSTCSLGRRPATHREMLE
jgi:hypothetical protein